MSGDETDRREERHLVDGKARSAGRYLGRGGQPVERIGEGHGSYENEVQSTRAVTAPSEEAASAEDAGQIGPEAAPAPTPAAESVNYRQVYETQLRPLPRDARTSMARLVRGPRLSALCFDPEPAVIRAVLDNRNATTEHARLIAAHHRTATGLDGLAGRTSFLADPEVRRSLLRNVQTSESLLRRLLESAPLPLLFRVNMGHELSDRARQVATRAMRRRFASGSAEDRVGLILATEGRCLRMLVGLPLDGKSVALLCRRGFASELLLRNLASWPSTPPPLIRHLLKQPLVQHSAVLKRLLLQHPNCPAQLKGG